MSPIEQSIKRKIEENGVPLKDWNISINYGIKTGYNDAFIINGEKKDELISADPKSAEIIRPILRGKDIKRYEYSFADLWIINSHNGVKEKSIPPINILEYPAIKAHLDLYYDELSKRYDKGDTPYNLRNCIYTDDFNRQKIIWGELSDKPKFALDKEGIFVISNTVFMMTGNHLDYLLAFLNSKLSQYYFSSIATTSGVGTVRWLKYKVELLPVPLFDNITPDIRTLMISLMEKPIENSQEIDRLIFSIYNFSPSEIELILNASSM